MMSEGSVIVNGLYGWGIFSLYTLAVLGLGLYYALWLDLKEKKGGRS